MVVKQERDFLELRKRLTEMELDESSSDGAIVIEEGALSVLKWLWSKPNTKAFLELGLIKEWDMSLYKDTDRIVVEFGGELYAIDAFKYDNGYFQVWFEGYHLAYSDTTFKY